MPATVLLGLAAAGLWGIGDFAGGMAVKLGGGSTASALRVVLLSHVLSLSILLSLALHAGDGPLHGSALVAGLAAGVASGLALSMFYMALARGGMGPSAAISGLLAAAIPALVSIAMEGAPGLRRGLGFLIAGAAIWLIAAGAAPGGVSTTRPAHSATRPAHSTTRPAHSTTWLAVAAGAGFGLYFVLLKVAGSAGAVSAMATARIGSIATCAALLLALTNRQRRRQSDKRPGRGLSARDLAWIAGAALFDTAGNLSYVTATRAGRLDVAAVLASLYPASTILLAALTLGERLTRRQTLGMAVATGAVVLITL